MIKEYIAKKDLLYVLDAVGAAIGIDLKDIVALRNAIDVYPCRKAKTYNAECILDIGCFIEDKGKAEEYVRSCIAGHFGKDVEPYFDITYEDLKETNQRRAHGELEVLL